LTTIVSEIIPQFSFVHRAQDGILRLLMRGFGNFDSTNMEFQLKLFQPNGTVFSSLHLLLAGTQNCLARSVGGSVAVPELKMNLVFPNYGT
jgi:hypothetical protein